MSKLSPRYDEDDAEKLWETVGRPDYDGPKMTMKSVAKWAGEDDPRGIVEKIMGGDEDMASFLQRLLGYGITGEVREEIFPVWTGSGRNGKGLLTQALQQLLGEYYKEMNCAVISDSRVCSNIDAERAKLIGARIAVFNELKPGEKLKTNEVQLLTGGDGFPVKAIYKNPGPHSGESETATLRQCDQTMKEKLKSPEGQSALFAWLVEGAVAWYGGTESLKAMAPTKVSEFTRKYLAEQDTVQAFLTDNCEFGKTFRESSVALFDMYCEVQEELGLNQQDVFGGSFLQGVPRVQTALLDDLRQLDNVSNSRM
eukprot:gene29230-biopygen8530